MPTQHKELWTALHKPFKEKEVKIKRITTKQGKVLEFRYITARMVINRFNQVFGPEGWWDKYDCVDGRWICTITVRLPDESLLSKQGVGGESNDMAESSDIPKSGEAESLKRAAVKFGVGLGLYDDGIVDFDTGEIVGAGAGNSREHANPSQGEPHNPAAAEVGDWHKIDPPWSGRGLFKLTKQLEERFKVSLLGAENEYIKNNMNGARMVDLSKEESEEVWDFAKGVLDEYFGKEAKQTFNSPPSGDSLSKESGFYGSGTPF